MAVVVLELLKCFSIVRSIAAHTGILKSLTLFEGANVEYIPVAIIREPGVTRPERYLNLSAMPVNKEMDSPFSMQHHMPR
jgi:hypothetical protein